MIQTDVRIESLSRNQVFLIEKSCTLTEEDKTVIRTVADGTFDNLMGYYEETNREELFEILLDILIGFVNMEEYDTAILYQEILLCRSGFSNEADVVRKLICEHDAIAEVYFNQMADRAFEHCGDIEELLHEDDEYGIEDDDPADTDGLGDSFMDAFNEIRVGLEDMGNDVKEFAEPEISLIEGGDSIE